MALLVLLLLFGVFLYYTIVGALRQRGGRDAYVEELHEDVAAQPPQPLWISLLLTVGGLVGVIFGVYPATRASRLDPITALRME